MHCYLKNKACFVHDKAFLQMTGGIGASARLFVQSAALALWEIVLLW